MNGCCCVKVPSLGMDVSYCPDGCLQMSPILFRSEKWSGFVFGGRGLRALRKADNESPYPGNKADHHKDIPIFFLFWLGTARGRGGKSSVP